VSDARPKGPASGAGDDGENDSDTTLDIEYHLTKECVHNALIVCNVSDHMQTKVALFLCGVLRLHQFALQDEADAIRNFKEVALEIIDSVDKAGDVCLHSYRDLLKEKLHPLLQKPCQESFQANECFPVCEKCMESAAIGADCHVPIHSQALCRVAAQSPVSGGSQTAAAGSVAATAARLRLPARHGQV